MGGASTEDTSNASGGRSVARRLGTKGEGGSSMAISPGTEERNRGDSLGSKKSTSSVSIFQEVTNWVSNLDGLMFPAADRMPLRAGPGLPI
jgi:hypothetical protein